MAYDDFFGGMAGFDPNQFNRDALLQQMQAQSGGYTNPGTTMDSAPLAASPSVAPPSYSPSPTAPSASNTGVTGAGSPTSYAAVPPPTQAPAPATPAPTSSYVQGTTYNPMAGWDVSKLNNPAEGTTIKYDFGRFIQNQGYDPVWARTHLPEIVQAFNQQFGTNAKALGDDTIDFGQPGWNPIDVLRSDNQWQWLTSVTTPEGQILAPKVGVIGQTTPTGGGAGLTGPTGGAFQESAANGGGLPVPGFMPNTPPPMPGATEDPTTQAIRQYLLRQIQGAGQPIDQNSPYIQQTMDAARAQADRAQQQERSQLAERLYAQGGLNSNALTMGIQQSNERNALGLAGLQAGLIGSEVAQQRAMLQQNLQLANAVGAREEALALQRQIADLDNRYRYAALNQQGTQFGQSLAQQGQQFGQTMGQREAEFARQLAQRSGEWNDTYGLNRLQIQNEMNRQAMLAALGYV